MIAALFAIGFAQPQPDLSLRLSVGQRWLSKLEERFFDLENGELVQADRFEITWTVKEKTEKGYVLESASKLTGTVLDGKTLPPPPDEPPSIAKQTIEANGKRPAFSEAPDSPWEVRFDRLMWFSPPPAGLTEWKVEYEAEPSGSIPLAASEFFLSGTTVKNKSQAFVIHTHLLERGTNPALDATGTLWIDAKTGWLLGALIKCPKAPMPLGENTLYRLEIELNSEPIPAKKP